MSTSRSPDCIRGKGDKNLIRFMQLNTQHAKQAQIELCKWTDKQKNTSYVILGQEPYLYKNTPAMQPRTAQRFYCRTNRPRTIIHTSQSLKPWYIDTLSNQDATVIVLKIYNRTTVIASCYLDYNNNNPVIPIWLQDIINYADQRGYAILMGIDTNCHSSLYGKETNKRGEALEDFIASNHLIVENIGLTETFKTKWGSSIVDVTLTKNLSVSVREWEVDTSYNGSDHNTILFNLETDIQKQEKQYIMHLTDWTVFEEHLNTNSIRIPNQITERRLEKCLDSFYTSVNKALDKSTPKKYPKPRDKNNPWWTKDFTVQRRALNSLYRARHNNEDTWHTYKVAEKEYRKACLKAKNNDWKDFLRNQDSIESINKLRKILELSLIHI